MAHAINVSGKLSVCTDVLLDGTILISQLEINGETSMGPL